MLGIPKMEPDCLSTQRFLAIWQIFRVPTAAAQARQDHRGPSLRPCTKTHPKWSRNAHKHIVSCCFAIFWGPGGPWPAHIVISARKTF